MKVKNHKINDIRFSKLNLLAITLFYAILNFAKCSELIPKALIIEVNRTEYLHEIYEFLQDNVFHILTEYPKQPQIKVDFDELFEEEMKTLYEPSSWHVTILNLEKDKTKINDIIYQTFKENQTVEINISTLIYVPGKVMVAPVFLDYEDVEHKIPHMTLILGGKFRPIDAYFILKSLFIENKELRSLYDEGFIKDPSFQLNLEQNHVRVLYEDKHKQEIFSHVYIIKYDSHLKLKGVTKKIYD